jgi:hypothetical protein
VPNAVMTEAGDGWNRDDADDGLGYDESLCAA